MVNCTWRGWLAWLVICPKSLASTVRMRRGELHTVQGVERFETKLQARPLMDSINRKLLEQRQGRILLAGRVDVGQSARCITHGVMGRGDKHIRIREVVVQPIRTRVALGPGQSHRAVESRMWVEGNRRQDPG